MVYVPKKVMCMVQLGSISVPASLGEFFVVYCNFALKVAFSLFFPYQGHYKIVYTYHISNRYFKQ